MGQKKQTKAIFVNFKEELEKFTDSVHSLSENGSLSSQEEFLLTMADNIHKLYDSSTRVIKCHDENVKEIGELVQNIFLQPVPIRKEKAPTIIKAVESFSKEQAKESDLSAILFEYITYPESTKSFIRELELLSEDLDLALESCAL